MAAKRGTLIVRSEPSNAIVIIDDDNKTSPAIFDLKVRAQPYNIRIEKVGYDDYINKIIIHEGSKIEIDAILTKTNND